MERFVVLFLRASLLWLAVAVSLGVAMAVQPSWLVYRPAHVHMALLGFVVMMISGVAYNVLPRFSGTPLHSRRLAWIHLWIANIGLALMVAGFVVRVQSMVPGAWLLGVGGVLSALGGYALAWNLWRTLDHAASRLQPPRPSQPLRVMHPAP